MQLVLVDVQRQFSILTHSPQGKRWWLLADCAWSCVLFGIHCVVESVKRLGAIWVKWSQSQAGNS